MMSCHVRFSIWCIAVLTIVPYGVFAEDDVCTLPPDSGSCEKDQPPTARFYYSTINMKCTQFPYSGCNGNKNNFKTEEECTKACGKTAPVTLKNKVDTAHKEKKCYYSGATYNVGTRVVKASMDNPCNQNCLCDSGANGAPNINCASVDCPVQPSTPGCFPVPVKDQCCSDYFCPKDTNSKGKLPQCKHNQETFVAGQMIYPDEYPCFQCACTKSYLHPTTANGACKEVNCNILVNAQSQIAKGCKPKYYKLPSGHQSCCPIDWECK